jgi:hypothetical protein
MASRPDEFIVELSGRDDPRLSLSFQQVLLMLNCHLSHRLVFLLHFGDYAIENATLIKLDSCRAMEQKL